MDVANHQFAPGIFGAIIVEFNLNGCDYCFVDFSEVRFVWLISRNPWFSPGAIEHNDIGKNL